MNINRKQVQPQATASTSSASGKSSDNIILKVKCPMFWARAVAQFEKTWRLGEESESYKEKEQSTQV